MTSPPAARRSNTTAYGRGARVTAADLIQKAIAPTAELRSGAALRKIRFVESPSKCITPERPASLAIHVAPILVPPCEPVGLLSTTTFPTGGLSKPKRTFNELSRTSAWAAGNCQKLHPAKLKQARVRRSAVTQRASRTVCFTGASAVCDHVLHRLVSSSLMVFPSE